MKIGFVSDSLGALAFEDMLDTAQRLGVDGVEMTTCGWSTGPHLDLEALATSRQARQAFSDAFERLGMENIALNANGNPVHPGDPAQGEGLRQTIVAAGELGLKTVCTMSGLPGGTATDAMPNWVVSS